MGKFLKLVKDYGLKNSLWFIMNRVFAHISPNLKLIRYYFVVQAISAGSLVPERLGKKVEFHEISEEEAGHIPWPRPYEVIDGRFRQGGRCLVAYRNGGFAGYLWFISGKYFEDEVRCCYILPNQETVWDFDVYVDPAHRLSPLFALLWEKAFSIMRSEYIKYTMSRISAFNPASLASHKRLGSQPIASGTFFCFGNAQISFLTVPPYFHVSMASDHYPTIQFTPSSQAQINSVPSPSNKQL